MKVHAERMFTAWRDGLGILAATLLLMNSPAFGQTIPNSSFETDTFTTAPGYINANAAITGWNANRTDLAGLNPAGGSSSFANNGAVPNGAQVAFLQGAAGATPALSAVISGLTPGQTYKVNFRVNSSTGRTAYASLKVALDDALVVALTNILPVSGTNPYRPVAFDFTATASTHTLSLTNDRMADSVALLDDFAIGVWTSGWSVASWSDDASSGVDGSRPYTHAYNFDSTSADAVINGVTFRGLAGANPAVAGEMVTSGFGSQWGNAGTIDANVLTAGGGGSATLASRFIYNGWPQSITIGGLVPGVEYLATFYSVAWDATEIYRSATFIAGSDWLTVNQDHFGDNNGIRVSYRYIAPASGKMTLSYMPIRDNHTIHTYGFSNREYSQTTPVVAAPRPASQISAPGATATFRAAAAGTRPLFYQWLKNGSAIGGATSAQLDVAVASGSDAGGYSAIVSNAFGVVTSSVATLDVGMIANPSFEADTFFAYPGYISANSAISGWTGYNTTRVGLNPVADGRSPFANTGTIPDGSQAAFIQSVSGAVPPSALSTVISGLTPGQTYSVGWRINARSGYTKPVLRAAVDGQPVVDMQVSAVGSTNPYRYAAFDFFATAGSHTLSFTNDVAADTAAIVDDFHVSVSTTRWSWAAWNDDTSSDVDASRHYTHAYSFGSWGDTDINGVHFTGLAGGNPSVAGELSTVGFPNIYLNDENFVRWNGGGSAVLARDFVYGGSPQSITLSGLVAGVEYVATVYGVAFDARPTPRAATFDVNGDRMTIDENQYDQDNGIRVSYRYVADASGTFTLSCQSTDGAATFHTFGLSNYELNTTNAPTVYREPRSLQWAAAGSDVVLQSLIGGQAPLFLQWHKDGVALADQTNATLTLSAVGTDQAGVYTLVISNALGAVTSSTATVEVGLTMVNPSFELDAFYVYPGYIGGNFPITGWDNTDVNAGVNPISYTGAANNPDYSPFANSGAIPDGRQAAFIQADSTMSQWILGFTVGSTYCVKYYENARSGYAAPSLSVAVGGVTVVPLHTVTSGVYRIITSEPFEATSDMLEVAFNKSGGDAVLIDCVGVLEVPAIPPEITMNPGPAEQWAAAGETVQLTAGAVGAMPLYLQWQRNGIDVQGQTSTVLQIVGIALDQGGLYRLVASNQYGSATSAVASVQVGLPFAELFNTGVDDSKILAAAGSADLHYALAFSADPAYPGPAAVVMDDVYPIGPYLANGPISKWISPMLNTAGYGGNLPGTYTYRTTFLLDTMDPAAARIYGQWAMDNIGVDIRLNGTSLGLAASGFEAWTPFVITNGFQAGTNVLEFVTSNAPPTGPTAMRVELRGIGMPLSAGMPQILGQPQNQLAQLNGPATFALVASGAAPLTYQWCRGTTPLPGETNRLLKFTQAVKADEGGYRCIVVNGSGPVTSAVAMLAVNLPPQPGPDVRAAVMDGTLVFPATGLLVNDTDPESDALVVTAVSATSFIGGTASLAGGSVTYSPLPGYSGDDEITYTVTDVRGGSATTNIALVVGPASMVGGAMNGAAMAPDGAYVIGFQGVANCPYTVEATTNLMGVWTAITNLITSPAGLLQLEDHVGPPKPRTRFYRIVYP